jgi:hypothetical protein
MASAPGSCRRALPGAGVKTDRRPPGREVPGRRRVLGAGTVRRLTSANPADHDVCRWTRQLVDSAEQISTCRGIPRQTAGGRATLGHDPRAAREPRWPCPRHHPDLNHHPVRTWGPVDRGLWTGRPRIGDGLTEDCGRVDRELWTGRPRIVDGSTKNCGRVEAARCAEPRRRPACPGRRARRSPHPPR